MLPGNSQCIDLATRINYPGNQWGFEITGIDMILLVDRKRSIGQASQEVGVQEHVLRFWETQFRDQIKPTLGNGGRRYFYDRDIKILKTIRHYLYDRGYTIRGLKNLIEKETLWADDDATSEKGDDGGGRHTETLDGTRREDYVGFNQALRGELKNFKVELNRFYERLKNI
jgi:DNA-binding transcriptional MerR regulator